MAGEKKKKSMPRWLSKRTVLVVLCVVALIAVPLVAFRVFTDSVVNDITQTISLQYSQEMHTQMASHIESTLDYYFHELNTEYNALKHIDGLNEAKLQKFISDVQADNGISYLAFVDDEGLVYEAEQIYFGTMRLSMIGELLSESNKRIVTDNETIGSESYIIVAMSFEEPVRLGEQTICAALLGMSDEDLTDHIVLQSDYSGGFSSIINTDGSYVMKNASEPFGGLNVFSIIDKNYAITDETLAALKNAVACGEDYLFNTQTDNGEEFSYLYFAPVENTDWYLVNTLPSAFIKGSIVNMRDMLEGIYVVFVVFFLMIATVVVVQMSISSTELKQSHVQTERALKSAEEASKAKTAFLFNMSHDIRTPMNAILGYTNLGLQHVEDIEFSRDSYKKIGMAGGHLLNLINDVLEMSRIESGKMKLDEKPMDIHRAIDEVTTMSRSLAEAKHMDYATEIGEIRNPYIYADELHLNEVIINIVSNAVKYTPEYGRVRYRISQLGEAEDGKVTYHFEISDNGIGMSEEFQRHIFETFSREENTTMSKTEGTGLGLSIVKNIVDMVGGTIRVHSVKNEGSTFTVDIPFRVVDEQTIATLTAEEHQAEQEIAEISFEGRKVLLAEDNELNREIATFILEDAGLEVETAEDGSLALKAVEEKGIGYYDFILMDIQMPVMDGYEATRRIRALPNGGDIPIIALSANAFEEDKRRSIAEGMNGHVAKPIDIKILLETMQGLMK